MSFADSTMLKAPAFFGRWLILYSYHVNDVSLPKYIARIRAFKPKFVRAYYSTIIIIANFVRRHMIKPFATLKVILCRSENIYPRQGDC
jgi:phenylacetate-CoA ligase